MTNTAYILQEDCILPLFSYVQCMRNCFNYFNSTLFQLWLLRRWDTAHCLSVGGISAESKDSARATFVTESAGFIMYDFIISLLCFSWMPCNALLCDGRKVKKEETHFTALKKSHYFLELFWASIIILNRLKKILLDLMCIWHNL